MIATIPDPNRAGVVGLVAKLDAAASERDIARFLGLFVDGSDFAFAVNGTILTTHAEVRAFHEAAWFRVRDVAFHTTVDRVAFPAPGVAVLCATGRSERTLVTGEQRTGAYALTLVLVRVAAGWRALQCHESTAAPAPGA